MTNQPTAGLMLGQRGRQRSSIKSTVGQCSEFAGVLALPPFVY